MKIIKAFKYKLEPKDSQVDLLYRMAGSGRVVFNDGLDFLLIILKKETGIIDKEILYKHLNDLPPKERIALVKKLPSAFDLNKLLTKWKKKEDRLWLEEAYTDNLQQRLKDLAGSVSEWCKGKRGFPVWRTRKKAHHSTMRFVNFSKYCSIEHRHIKLPNKLGLMRYRDSQPVVGKPKNATVSLNACGEWHISIMCEMEIELPSHVDGGMTGIDMGIAKNMTLSTDICGDNGVFHGVHSYRTHQAKLAITQKKMSRKVKGSSNWKKQNRRVSNIHQRIANIRRDYQQKATTEISNNHAMIVCEALKVVNMSKSAKGDKDNHGKMVKQKAGLNKSILDEGWGELRRQLEYKMLWKGGMYAEVNPAHTSQICSCCGHKAKENRTTQANFVCVNCGYSINADKNAANNILNRYLSELEQAE
jgi:putative transposase